jgi:hypothetical protein
MPFRVPIGGYYSAYSHAQIGIIGPEGFDGVVALTGWESDKCFGLFV